ncbi:hypothetical protein [Mesorhizobium amorphae]|uniref:hypothetical protein n=1 Tax=Mesorhizobium amorphae TaxID=71433 RepID=UPI001111D065|nr:hypothetical protein [Mesorhizobium amorphae]
MEKTDMGHDGSIAGRATKTLFAGTKADAPCNKASHRALTFCQFTLATPELRTRWLTAGGSFLQVSEHFACNSGTIRHRPGSFSAAVPSTAADQVSPDQPASPPKKEDAGAVERVISTEGRQR